jgi:3-deoxy-manno-octulosonate cytidylyltransferase (CMP-KDO synthetase)
MTSRATAAVLGVVPARFASQRFPGKLLADLCGKPVVVRTVVAALKATTLSDVWVATDDDRIGHAIKSTCPRAEVVYTDPSCPSGSDRVVAALNARGLISTAGHPTAGHDHTASCLPLHPPPSHPDAVLSASFPFDVIVNVQGDEPLLNPTHIDSAVHALLESPDADIATLVHRLDTTSKTGAQAAMNRNNVKCVMDGQGFALYFSRGLIPNSPSGEVDMTGETQYYKHVGLYAYRPGALLKFVDAGPSLLEQRESLEQLRALELGMRIKVVEVGEAAMGIDTKEQLEIARDVFRFSKGSD